jgi:three-Cys-motif partner protein
MSCARRDDPHKATGSRSNSFGGHWTSEKLEVLKKYLRAYRMALSKQTHFQTMYIDAFAGSGYINVSNTCSPSAEEQITFDNFSDESADRLIQGSASAALEVDPPFHKYLFIEKKKMFVRDLQGLRERYPERAETISIKAAEANTSLRDLCIKTDWSKYRAVLFLDPYGMQVQWDTLKTVANTGAIDLWYLFPLGIGVSRLLKNDGRISETHQMKLDDIFGTTQWREAFYEKARQTSLFENSAQLEKTANFNKIEDFFLERLRTIFPKVADKPIRMINSRGNSLYSFCFAAGNPGKGGEIALRIARHLLGK